ncbi:hypothetical protein XI08_05480 [Bradyrhizobium sp. CCBAU 11361]|nr:hypothetical protein [Bradyrhizobium sp. CCBAU 11361]
MSSIAFFIAQFVPWKADLVDRGCALARGQHMIELWNKWSGTLASVEALAAVVVIAVVTAGILTLIESQRHRTKH